MMNIRSLILVSMLAMLASLDAQAHKRWFLPTDFALSDAETVTVDFSASNNIFYVDNPMPLQGIKVLSPQGEEVVISNGVVGARRTSFDIAIEQEGTYRVMTTPPAVYFLAYKMPGEKEMRYERGPLEKLKASVPKEAESAQFAEANALIETYITLGAESEAMVDNSVAGLSLKPVSHPNMLYSDEPAEFRLFLDGKPAPELAITIVPEGTRYRDGQGEKTFTADQEGLVTIEWPQPGRYLLEAAVEQKQESGEFAMLYYSYFLTVEVLAP